MEHTKGKVDGSHKPIDNDENAMYATQVYTTADGETICTLAWYPTPKEKVVYEGRDVLITKTYREGNAELIADAFNTTNESGLTPSQLYKQNQELLDALEKSKDKISELFTKGVDSAKINSELFTILEQAINNAKTK